MIKSMTGFAALTRADDNATVSVTIKSVNHRFLDLQFRMPSALQHLESAIRARAQEVATRGRVEVSISLQRREKPALDVQFNDELVSRVHAWMAELRGQGIVAGEMTPAEVLRIPQAFVVREMQPDEQAESGKSPVDGLVLGAVNDAFAALDEMRRTEGAMLQRDLDARVQALGDLFERIVEQARAAQDSLQQRLQERIATIAVDPAVDKAVIAAEIVRFVARSDIDEEMVRFRTHVSHWRSLSDGPEPCGRKLDFLIQEMNREINTTGSKAEGETVPGLIIAAKAELERLREQVQNVE